MVPSRVYHSIILLLFYISYLLYIPKCSSINCYLYWRKRNCPVFKTCIFLMLTCIFDLVCSKERTIFLNLYSRLFYFVGYFLSLFVFYNCCSILTFQNLTLALYKHFRCKSRLYLLKVFNETFSPTLKKNKLRNAFLNQSALMSSFLSVYLSGIFLLSAFACM